MDERTKDLTYYEILEVTPDATHHEIVAAYEKAKLTYSEDSPSLYSVFSPEEAAEWRRLIEEAYLIIGHQVKRREYDNVLQARQNSSPHSAPQPNTHATAAPAPMPVTPPHNSPAASTAAASPAQIPQGFAKTRLGIYELNSDFENEIQSCEKFDGEFIKKVRQYKGMSIDQVSKETRISKSYLAALEANDYDSLPAAVFTRGFVIQVARLLALDENKVASTYMALYKSKRP